MSTIEFELRLGVVIENVLPSFEMTLFAFVTQTLTMNIVFGVTAFARAVGRNPFVFFALWMTGVAIHAFGHGFVEPEKWPRTVLHMIKTHRFPNARLMTSRTLISQAPFMK